MLAQFQVRYPTGSLISELVTVDHGKYIVRASVQIEGVTRATGMAAADTIEVAEDRARIRALEVLGIQSSLPQPPATEPQRQTAAHPSSEPLFSRERLSATPPVTHRVDTSWLEDDTTPLPLPEPLPERKTPVAPEAATTATSHVDWQRPSYIENPPVEEKEPTVTDGKVTPIGTRRSNPAAGSVASAPAVPEIDRTPSEAETAPEPIDLSDAIARTDVEIKRLGWTKKQGIEYLQRTYGKKTRNDLDPDQLLEFLQYLESQDSPS